MRCSAQSSCEGGIKAGGLWQTVREKGTVVVKRSSGLVRTVRVGTVASLLMCAAWLVSLWWDIGWIFPRARWIDIGRGVVRIGYDEWGVRANLIQGLQVDRLLHIQPLWWFELGHRSTRHWLIVPLWAIALLTSVPTAISFAVLRNIRSKDQAPRCKCGYDLGGLPIDFPCPECGRRCGEAAAGTAAPLQAVESGRSRLDTSLLPHQDAGGVGGSSTTRY
jgi:hypothetical protein